ncbi:MAG: ECF-type sigma factor [Planctomycetota bacterium]
MTRPAKKKGTAPLPHANGSDGQVLARLMELTYEELRALAHYLLNGRHHGDIPRTTSLVHEACLRLLQQQDLLCLSRQHLLGLAGRAMRCVKVDRFRRLCAAKRGGGGQGHLTLDEAGMLHDRERNREKESLEMKEDLEALDEALMGLAALHPRPAQVVELRYFGELTIEQTAEALEVSPATVKRDWDFAKAWLLRKLSGD